VGDDSFFNPVNSGWESLKIFCGSVIKLVVIIGSIKSFCEKQALEFLVGQICKLVQSHGEGEILCIVFLDQFEVLSEDLLAKVEFFGSFVLFLIFRDPFRECEICLGLSSNVDDQEAENNSDWNFDQSL